MLSAVAALATTVGCGHDRAAPVLAPRAAAAEAPASPDLVDGVAHLNAQRAAAGLAPVRLDAARSEGTALHARYLTLNAGRPEIARLRAHHERPPSRATPARAPRPGRPA